MPTIMGLSFLTILLNCSEHQRVGSQMSNSQQKERKQIGLRHIFDSLKARLFSHSATEKIREKWIV